MTEYLDVLQGKSTKLFELCCHVEKEYMTDKYASKWATYGIHSVFMSGNRFSYQSELLLGIGVTNYQVLSLWDGAGITYLLYFLIHGPLDKFDRNAWKIIGETPDYSKKVYQPMDTYVQFVWRTSEKLEEIFEKSDVDTACRMAMLRAKYVVERADMSIYPAFAPELTEFDLRWTISDCVSVISELTEEDVKKFPLEMRGECRYCIRRAKALNGKLPIYTGEDMRVSIFDRGEKIFKEALIINERTASLPYDISRMRRLVKQYGCRNSEILSGNS